MILDVERFVSEERPYWKELEAALERQDRHTAYRMTVDEAQRFFYLYERCSASLARLAPLSVDAGLRTYLESLVARAYGEVHEVRRKGQPLRPARWFVHRFPRVFREHLPAFGMTVALTILGVVFGVVVLATDSDGKRAIMPFAGLNQDPKVRVEHERASKGGRIAGHSTEFSAQLMTHNTRVAIFTMALGITFGAGTTAVLFYNGVVLGAVAFDYMRAGQGVFLAGWLLPHGSVEIPAILIGGQAGFVFASALIGWGSRLPRSQRLRCAGPDIVTLVGGTAVLLVWAGIVEAFFSQYHEPVVPYALKIAFGAIQLSALVTFLARSGAKEA